MKVNPDKTTLQTLPFDRDSVAEQLKRSQGKQAFFLVIDGVEIGRLIPLDRPRLVLGRDPACDVVLRDDGISRCHAEVLFTEQERVRVRDLGSTNGIYRSGERVEEALLVEGDKVLLGRRTILKFVRQDAMDEMYQRQMYESAMRDGLTGVYNRKHFDTQLVATLSFARRHQLPVSLLIFDLDHFKRVNDTFGHLSGDLVLVAVSEAITQMIRSEDLFARYGGEEFAILALGVDEEGARSFAERLRQKVSEVRVKCRESGQDWIQVTVSVGVATVLPDSPGSNPRELIACADRCLYEAKHQGRNRVVAGPLP